MFFGLRNTYNNNNNNNNNNNKLDKWTLRQMTIRNTKQNHLNIAYT
jgi:hypothetical protein